MTDNVLSQKEINEGWRLLFDGSSMTEWRVYGERDVRGWEVSNGEMTALGIKGSKDYPDGDIITRDIFENFELYLEWKISTGGNSGIFFNVVESPEYDFVYVTGPEYQLLDDVAYEGRITPLQYTGANYDMHEPKQLATNPQGTYNSSRLIVDHGHVQHWLNGAMVVEYDLWSEDWKRRLSQSKFTAFPGYAKAQKGHIALQDHGGQTSFKNVKIRTL